MASLQLYLILSLALQFTFFINHTVNCDEEDTLLLRINMYRASLNLTSLTENNRADCLAEEIADLLENQPCTNTTGPNAIPGTDPQFSSYPALLAKCHLSPADTLNGVILPVCVPNLAPSLVVSSFTQSRYSNYTNDTRFSAAGIGSEDNWIVVVLTTNAAPAPALAPGGSFLTGISDGSVVKAGLICNLMFLLVVGTSLLL